MKNALADIMKVAPELSQAHAIAVYNYDVDNCVVDWSETSWQQLRNDVLWMAEQVTA